jgi:NIMA (never in mitosis gene a)-related kinase
MDKYQQVRELGRGAFGKALLMKRRSSGVHYVIKEVNMSQMKKSEKEEAWREVEASSE